MKQVAGWMMMVMAMIVGGAGSAAADKCSACNTITQPEKCCRKTPGCETYASEQAGQNFCRASRPAETPRAKASAVECKRNYSTCIRGVTSRVSKFKSTEVNGKKLSRKDVAAAVRADRALCQSRLNACKRQVE